MQDVKAEPNTSKIPLTVEISLKATTAISPEVMDFLAQ